MNRVIEHLIAQSSDKKKTKNAATHCWKCDCKLNSVYPAWLACDCCGKKYCCDECAINADAMDGCLTGLPNYEEFQRPNGEFLFVCNQCAQTAAPRPGHVVFLPENKTIKIAACKGYRPGNFFVIEDEQGNERLIRRYSQPGYAAVWGEY